MMKKRSIILYILIGLLPLTSCHKLDLNPLAKGSTENWYSSEDEVRMAVNNLYSMSFWSHYTEYGDSSDDFMTREALSSLENGTLSGQSSYVITLWANQYKAIARANSIILNADRAVANGASAVKIDELIAEARFHRACAYAKLLPLFGDVPLVDKDLDIDAAFKNGRTAIETVMKFTYDDFDAAAAILPLKSTEQRATKGAALAFKARFALYMKDWNTAAQAAKAVIDLGIYSLHSNYADLFLAKTKQSNERVFAIPRSIIYDVVVPSSLTRSYLSRNVGGFAEIVPSWDLLASYTCTDGLPIDRSPLFDSHDPFKNRDPRCKNTIVPFGEEWLGYEYNPHPDAITVMNFKTGKMVTNNDNRKQAAFASFNGLVWKKGIDETWLENGFKADPDLIVIRYAEVLLTYAEAKIEMEQIDQSVLDAMNMVRARAYGVDKSAISQYPAFTSIVPTELKIQLRTERRMEFAKENMRYMDLLRWKYAEIVMKRKGYIMLYPSSKLIDEITSKGQWFWSFSPDIDENGLPDFSKLENAGKIQPLTQRLWLDRQYLWPIPTTEVQINKNMKQNPGY